MHAVRRDLADIRLADRVFAPHYASAVPRFATRAVPVRAARATDSDVVGLLRAGDVFEVLEFSNGQAWGTATALALVGYVDTAALSWAAP